jgi:hypothetical protein
MRFNAETGGTDTGFCSLSWLAKARLLDTQTDSSVPLLLGDPLHLGRRGSFGLLALREGKQHDGQIVVE